MGNQARANPGSVTSTNGHLAVPGAANARGQPSSNVPLAVANGLQSSNAMSQSLGNGRLPANMMSNQRMSSQYALGTSANDQNLQQLMQHVQPQLRGSGGVQGQRPISQSQFHRGSIGTGSMNGNASNLMSNTNLGAYSGTGAGPQSPEAVQKHPMSSAQTSPNMNSHLFAQDGSQFPAVSRPQSQSQPHSLSSGHVPAVKALEYEISQQNPNMAPEEIKTRATEKMIALSQRTAIHAASGMLPQHHQQNMNIANQNPFSQNIYMQNGIVPQAHGQGRSASPVNSMAHQQNQQLSRHLSQQLSVGARAGVLGAGATTNHVPSPVANANNPNFANSLNRTPTPNQNQGGRPLSSGVGVNVGAVGVPDQARPGSSQAPPSSVLSQSPALKNSQIFQP